MYRLKHLLFLCLTTVLAAGCEKENLAVNRDLEAAPANYVRFDAPEVGQRSFYLLADIRSGNPEVRYTGDTLVLEVTARDGDLFTVTETFTPGSPNRDVAQTRYCDTIRYGLSVGNDVLQAVRTIDCRWSYLVEELPVALPLAPMPALAELDGWQVLPFDDGNDDLILNGHVENFTHLGVRYDHLNVLVDTSLEPLDGNKRYWLYDGETGVVRFVSFNAFSGRGRVADLLVAQN